MAEQGHNSELTPEERRALRMHHLRQMAEIDAEMQPLKDRRKQIRSEAKSDGFKLADIDAAYRVMTMEDTSIFVEEIHEMIDIAKAFNALPPGENGDLFPDRRPSDEAQYDLGVVEGLEGKDAPDASQQDRLRGWHEGQRQMLEVLQSAMEKRNAAKEDTHPADDMTPDSEMQAAE